MSKSLHDSRDADARHDRRNEDHGVAKQEEVSYYLDLPAIARDSYGIPTFIFQEGLTPAEQPTEGRKVLEVSFLWRESVMSVGHYEKPRTITVGDHASTDFHVVSENLLPIDRFPLIEGDGHGFLVNWTDKMALEARLGDGGDILDKDGIAKRQRLEHAQIGGAPAYRVRLELHDRVAVQLGEVTFVVQYVAPPQVPAPQLLKTFDFYFTKVLSLSVLAHAFLILALVLTPFDPFGLSEDLFKNPNRFAKLMLKEVEKPKPTKKKFDLEGAKAGGRHKDKEGKFGKPDKKKKDALASTKGAPRVDPNKREKDRKVALDSGIFAALKGGKDGAASNVFGPGGLGTGVNQALGGLRGGDMGDAGGAGGLGTRGAGPGGGGNSLGIGGLGDGSGRGTGGLGNVDLGGRGRAGYKVSVGRTVTKGCLSQQVVGRVLTRVHSQARYCYEKELTRNPNLSGKITTEFTIGPTGAVTSARVSETTMGDPAVENCLLRVIERLKFPPCAGGGVAEVKYPWIFKAGGE